MAAYASGSIRFSGLGSDTDFDTMIKDLYKIESRYANQLMRWREDWKTRTTAFQEVRTSLVSLQAAMRKINSVDKFLVKSATSSATSVATATITSGAENGSHTVNVSQIAAAASWSKYTSLTDKNAPIGKDDGSGNALAGTFSYQYKGEEHSINVPPGTTLEGLKNLINNNANNPGVKASLMANGAGYVFQLRGMETGEKAPLTITDTSNLQGFDMTWLNSGSSATLAMNVFTDGTQDINSTGSNQVFSFVVNGVRQSLVLPSGTTVDGLTAYINANTATLGVSASLVPADGGVRFGLTSSDGTPVTIDESTTLPDFIFSGAGWQFKPGQNAQLTVDGMPIETATNNISGVIDGMTFNIRSTGVAVISVDIATDTVRENVEAFVKAVNDVRILIKELTHVDKDKTVVLLEYAESQFEMQKGSALTGNYGIQLISSRLKSAISGGGKGFVQKSSFNDPFGDVFTSLSQIGIVTNSDANSENFGLLEIRYDKTDLKESEFVTFTEALQKDPQSVARLFSASGQGATHFPPPFTCTKTTIDTEDGLYDVSYNVDAMGIVTAGKINGKAAQYDPATKMLSLLSSDAPPNNADGIGLYISNLQPGAYNGSARVTTKGDPPVKEGTTSIAAAFSFESSLYSFGITKPGLYDVRYEVDSLGNIIAGTAFINGKEAAFDPTLNQLSLIRSDGTENDADGIILTINDVSQGTHTGNIAIQQGKISEVLYLLEGGGTQDTAGILDTEHGSLTILERSYRTIIENIDKKILKEDTRLDKWTTSMRRKFARLEVVLGKYEKVKTSIDSMVTQLTASNK